MNKNTAELAEVIQPLLERAARDGLVWTYDQLLARAEVAELCGSDRTRLYDALDAINDETCKDGHLLSAVVIDEGGAPGTGFFRKLRDERWLPRKASRASSSPGRVAFRDELAEVFRKFSAPQKVAAFIDLENMTAVQDGVIAAVAGLWENASRQKTSVYPMGFHHPGIETRTSVGQWKRGKLAQIKGLKLRPAHEDAAFDNDAADTELIGEWRSWVLNCNQSEFFPRVILTPGDIVCLFSDDSICQNVVLKAADAGFKVWGFVDDGITDANPQYRDTFRRRGRLWGLRSGEELSA